MQVTDGCCGRDGLWSEEESGRRKGHAKVAIQLSTKPQCLTRCPGRKAILSTPPQTEASLFLGKKGQSDRAVSGLQYHPAELENTRGNGLLSRGREFAGAKPRALLRGKYHVQYPRSHNNKTGRSQLSNRRKRSKSEGRRKLRSNKRARRGARTGGRPQTQISRVGGPN